MKIGELHVNHAGDEISITMFDSIAVRAKERKDGKWVVEVFGDPGCHCDRYLIKDSQSAAIADLYYQAHQIARASVGW